MSYRKRIAAAAAVALAAPLAAAPSTSAAETAGTGEPGQVAVDRVDSPREWRAGDSEGLFTIPGINHGGVVMSRPAGTREYTDPHTQITRTYEYSTWTSPVIDPDFDVTEIVASWNADTPAGTWVEVEIQAAYTNDQTSPWFVLGRWTSGDGDTDIRRTSVNRQGDPYSTIWTDTFSIDDASAGVLVDAYQLRLTLNRPEDSHRSPRVWMLGGMASAIPDRFEAPPSEGGIAWGTELDVPARSQNIHAGDFPEFGGGGAVWCSPTSTTMVMEYYGFEPSRRDVAWVRESLGADHPDPQVDHAARYTWDYTYEGAGNWPFNTAYASSYGLDGFVTRLRSLDDAERMIAAGIPVVTSVSFLQSELDGAGYGTNGHLMVIVGFTEDGDVIANDPASLSNEKVRKVYQREQFERIWLRTKRVNASGGTSGGPGGIAYIITAPWKTLPAGGDGAW
jgi:hypothetical protein